MSLYNISGQKLNELVNENKPAGSYNLLFSGSDLATGIYFIRLTADDQLISKKISFIK